MTSGCNNNYPSKVAKIGRRMKDADPLPPSIWRDQLKRLGYWMLMAIVGMLWLSFLVACTYAYAN